MENIQLGDQLTMIEIACQPIVIPHPVYENRFALSEQVETFGLDADSFTTIPLALLRTLGMTPGESSMMVLRHLAETLYVLEERDNPGGDLYHWYKWDMKLRTMFPPGTLDTLLAMLDRDGYIEHWGEIHDARPTILGQQMLLECVGCLGLDYIGI